MVTPRSLNFVTLSIVSLPMLMFGGAGHDLVNPIHISFVLSVFNFIANGAQSFREFTAPCTLLFCPIETSSY